MYNKAEERERDEAFKRNIQLESLLNSLNGVLCCAEEQLLTSSEDLGSSQPLVFIMGPLRSGTTLFTQWLASTGIVSYPTNLLSRFYGAPLVGAQIQLLLTDPRFNFRNEILDFNSSVSFESENGKTEGALAPNEFWYFWRRFLPFKELDWLSDEELFHVVDKDRLVSELEGLTRVFDKPFALKGMILNYNIPFLDAIFDRAIFIEMRREPVNNVASILDARRRQLGNDKEWYSFKIPEYSQLKGLDPVMQSAGQLHYINAAVKIGMGKVNESRKLVVEYEEFCQSPRRVFDELVSKLDLSGCGCAYTGPEEFKASRIIDKTSRVMIEKALSAYTSK